MFGIFRNSGSNIPGGWPAGTRNGNKLTTKCLQYPEKIGENKKPPNLATWRLWLCLWTRWYRTRINFVKIYCWFPDSLLYFSRFECLYINAAFICSLGRCGYEVRMSSTDIPAVTYCTICSTVILVPLIIGLPNIILGLQTIVSVTEVIIRLVFFYQCF